jgi:hypothetical protein
MGRAWTKETPTRFGVAEHSTLQFATPPSGSAETEETYVDELKSGGSKQTLSEGREVV